MSRSGYSDRLSMQELALWRGAVASAIRGQRGQLLLTQLRDALEAMPARRLIADELETFDGSNDVCALGAVGRMREISMRHLDPDNPRQMAAFFDCAPALAAEIVFTNDEGGPGNETPEERWARVHAWVVENIR